VKRIVVTITNISRSEIANQKASKPELCSGP
jgi:hypothetical protein